MPDVGRVHVTQWPTYPRGAHGGARLADVREDGGGAGATPLRVPVQVFAANRDPNDQGIELWILLHGCRERVQLIRDDCLTARTPDPEK